MKNLPITVWKFDDAPKELRAASDKGGDEDWLAEIPPNLVESWIPWMDDGGPFGCFSVTEYDHPKKPGYKIKIGSHA